MAAIGLNHYNIRVPLDMLQQLRNFYCAALGLTVGERPPFNSIGYWLYAGGNPILHLSCATGDDVRATDTASTLDHVAFSCTDLDAMRAQLDTLGVAYTEKRIPSPQQTQLFFRDPAGNRIELNFANEPIHE